MTSRNAHLVDRSATRVACLRVGLDGDRYRGTVSLDAAPAQFRQLFQDFEEMAEGQMFGLADELEEKIAALSLKVVFEDGTVAEVEDLQVYPGTKRVSFKTKHTAPIVE